MCAIMIGTIVASATPHIHPDTLQPPFSFSALTTLATWPSWPLASIGLILPQSLACVL